MRAPRASRLLAGALGALTLGALAAACKPIAGGYCDKVCRCTECDDYERDQCIDTIKAGRASAEDAGCGGEFDSYLSCTTSELYCDDGALLQESSCPAERDALMACGGTATLSCEVIYLQFMARYAECGIEIGGGGIGGECPPDLAKQLTCVAECTLGVPCGGLTGEDLEAQAAYTDCLTTCIP